MDKICTSGRIRSCSHADQTNLVMGNDMSCMGDRRDPLGTNALLSHRSKDSAVFKLHEDGSTFRRGAPGGHSAFSAENDPTCAIGCVSILQNSHLQLTSWTRCANRRLCAVCAQMLRCSNASGQSLGKVLDQA